MFPWSVDRWGFVPCWNVHNLRVITGLFNAIIEKSYTVTSISVGLMPARRMADWRVKWTIVFVSNQPFLTLLSKRVIPLPRCLWDWCRPAALPTGGSPTGSDLYPSSQSGWRLQAEPNPTKCQAHVGLEGCTVKKVSGFPVPSQDVTYQTLNS